MAEWSMAVVLKVIQGWEGHQLLQFTPIKLAFSNLSIGLIWWLLS
jgi:hypothetical protein